MAITQQAFGTLPSFDFTFSPGRKPTQPYIEAESPAKSTALDDTTRPLIFPSSDSTEQSAREADSLRDPLPPSSDQPTTSSQPEDDLTERIKAAAGNIVNEHIATVLKALAEDRNMLERGLVNHFGTRIEMLRASAAESCDKKLRDMEVTVQRRFKVNENRIESVNNGNSAAF